MKQDDHLPKYICIVCWNKTGKFHSFHRAVQTAQANYLLQCVKNDFNGIEATAIDENVTNHNPINLPTFIEVPQSSNEYENERIDAEYGNVFQEIESNPVRSGTEFLTEVKIGPMLGMYTKRMNVMDWSLDDSFYNEF